MQALQFSVTVPQWIALKGIGKVNLDGMVSHTFALQDFEQMIEVNLNKEKHNAVKTAVSFT